jgi:hypothetical protein
MIKCSGEIWVPTAFRNRTHGPPPFSATRSTPAVSRAVRMAGKSAPVETRLRGASAILVRLSGTGQPMSVRFVKFGSTHVNPSRVLFVTDVYMLAELNMGGGAVIKTGLPTAQVLEMLENALCEGSGTIGPTQ